MVQNILIKSCPLFFINGELFISLPAPTLQDRMKLISEKTFTFLKCLKLYCFRKMSQ